MLLSGHRLNEKHHESVVLFSQKFGSPDFWQLFKYLKKEGGDGIWVLWGCLSPLCIYRRNEKSGCDTKVCFLVLQDIN